MRLQSKRNIFCRISGISRYKLFWNFELNIHSNKTHKLYTLFFIKAPRWLCETLHCTNPYQSLNCNVPVLLSGFNICYLCKLQDHLVSCHPAVLFRMDRRLPYRRRPSPRSTATTTSSSIGSTTSLNSSTVTEEPPCHHLRHLWQFNYSNIHTGRIPN